MTLKNAILVLMNSLASLQLCLAQEIDFEGNWFREIKGYDDYYTSFDFRPYTKDDVVKAKKRYEMIKQFPFKNEWEGVYTSFTETGTHEFHWSASGGFIGFYVYHTLAALDFGSAADRTDSVVFVSEKSSSIKRKSTFSRKLVKIKFGDKHYLVPENRVKDFTERAAGLNVDITDLFYYLEKPDEADNKVYGSPVLPPKYRRFLRYPVSTKIIRLGNRQLHQDKFDDGTVNSEEIYRFVVLGAGKNKGIKVGMIFFIEDLSERVEITKVLPNTSIGRLRRGLDENRREECRNLELGQGDLIPCREIKVGMTAKTKISEASF